VDPHGALPSARLRKARTPLDTYESMFAMIDDPPHPEWAESKYWGPFIVVGEPAMSYGVLLPR